MKKFIFLILLVMLVSLLVLPSIVLGSYDYYIPITVTNNGGALSGVPVLVSLSNSQLASLGYIESSGLDTSTLEGTNPVSYLVTDDNLGLFIPSILGSQSRTYHYRLGDSVGQEDFPVIVGSGGYITLDDGDTPELGNNFEIEFEGWIDTTVAERNKVCKEYAFNITEGGGNVNAYIYGFGVPTTVNLVPDGTGDYTNIASQYPASTSHYDKVDDTPASPDDGSTYVYTISGTQQKDAYTLTYNSALDGVQINSITVYYRFCHAASSTGSSCYPSLRLGSSETTGAGSAGTTSWVTHSETLGRPGGGSWATSDIQDLQVCIGLQADGVHQCSCTQVYVQVNYSPAVVSKTLTAYGVPPEEHIVNVWADGVTFGVDIDGVTENSTAVASVPNQSTNWVISNLPYFNYYRQEVSGNPEVWYQPVTMVLGTVLTDRSGNGAHGVITWGSNLGSIGVEIGGIGPYVSYVIPGGSNGTESIPSIMPPAGTIPTDGTIGATGEGLPLYYSFKGAADSLDWTVPTTYMVMFIIISLAMGFAGMVAMRTMWGFTIGFGAFSVFFSQVRDSGGYTMVPFGITILCVAAAIFIGYLCRNN